MFKAHVRSDVGIPLSLILLSEERFSSLWDCHAPKKARVP